MTIAKRGDELVITIPANLIDEVELQKFIDFIRYRTLVSKSKAKEEEIQQLSAEINEELSKRNQSSSQK